MIDEPLTLFDDWLDEQDAKRQTYIGDVYLVRSDDEFRNFLSWLHSHKRPIAFDIEATGLDIYSPTWEIKSIQFGDIQTAWVFLWAEKWFQPSIDEVIKTDYQLLAHNASYDALGLDRHNHVSADKLMRRTIDTKILSHLADPRSPMEGGVGHALKNLAAHYVTGGAQDSQSVLKRLFKSQGWSESTGWAKIPASHPTLVRYAGIDVILTARLYEKLDIEIRRQTMEHLVKYEHTISRLVAAMERRGMRVDLDYASSLEAQFSKDIVSHRATAQSYGLNNVESDREIASRLQEMGVVLLETTATGQPKVDKTVLGAIAAGADDAAKLAASIMAAKNAAKLRESYIVPALRSSTTGGRVHPRINSLQARTGRMSVTSPPLQQLPSGGDAIRRMFIAEEGCVMSSVDFAGVELRVLAALSQDPIMVDVFRENADLHQRTADATGVSRKVAKTVNFGKVYGAGPKTLARQSGLTLEEAQVVCDMFDTTYTGVTAYSKKLAHPIKTNIRNFIITETGRKLPVDSDRAYSALNYAIQSTARDVLGRAMLRLESAGLWDYAVLPIHDEILFSFPTENADELCRAAAATMEMVLKNVHISAEGDVGGSSWGSLYTSEEHHVVELTDSDRMMYGDHALVSMLFGNTD